jgi:hypothetical protein
MPAIAALAYSCSGYPVESELLRCGIMPQVDPDARREAVEPHDSVQVVVPLGIAVDDVLDTLLVILGPP